MGDIVLSYHDSLLREDDVALLSGKQWLNDNIISFYMEYLQKEKYEKFTDVIFISPDVVQLIKTLPMQQGVEVLQSLELANKKLILLPINDSSDLENPGGTHWSLLVYQNSAFEHYDSLAHVNHRPALQVANKLIHSIMSNSASKVIVKEMDCVYQDNCYDCGIHVLCNADAICVQTLLGDERHISKIANSDNIDQTRMSLKKLIEKLRVEGMDK